MATQTLPFPDRETFQAWKEDHRTQGFLRYLRDRQSDLMEQWGKGLVNSNLPEIQAQAVALGQLAGIGWDEIAAQYGIEPPEEAEVGDEQQS